MSNATTTTLGSRADTLTAELQEIIERFETVVREYRALNDSIRETAQCLDRHDPNDWDATVAAVGAKAGTARFSELLSELELSVVSASY